MVKYGRNKAIYGLYEKKGLSQEELGELFELSQSAVSKIIISMRNGAEQTKEERRGSKPKLKAAQKEWLKKMLSQSPKTYGYQVWDKWSIKSLIKQEFNVDYHENYIWEIMKSLRFSSQKPKKKDYRQNPELIKKFKEEKATAIKKKPKQKTGN